jgi:hypothetical protein
MITWPSNTVQIIDEIRVAIGRNVTFYVLDTQTVCPTCDVDPVTNTATDPFCLTCSGLGYLFTYSGVTMSGHVTWGHSELLSWQTGGKLDEGDCRVQVKYTEANLEAIDNMKWAVVDGKEMFFLKKTLRGVQPLNRILVDLIERKDG